MTENEILKKQIESAFKITKLKKENTMLNIYTTLDDDQKDKLISNIDEYFENNLGNIAKDNLFKKVLREVDKAELVDTDTIKTQDGVESSLSNISKEAKSLIVAINFDDVIIDFNDLSGTAFDTALKISKKEDLDIYLTHVLPCRHMKSDIVVDGMEDTVLGFFLRLKYNNK